MVARLLLALLLAAFAWPALANGPCCDMPVAAMAVPHHAGHAAPARRDHATAPHLCIGCVPPASLASPVAVAPLVGADAPRRIVAAAVEPASDTSPTLRPPRAMA
jgi:hypothetical protein